MNTDVIHGKWKEISGKLIQAWGKLTHDEILKMKGSREELEGILQKKYGYSKEQTKKEVDDFIKKNNL
ncbi:MAG: CsbD family protein [Proteobacteria bacterium]|nr:CsbD family protein [Pseudomonadota bacterium]